MKKPNVIARALPHLCIILCCMILTFLIIDHYNSAMVFINNDITKGLMFALCLLYGFQGRLYGQDELLARVRRACRALLLRPEILPAAETASAQHARQVLLRRLETAGYVLIPVIVCILFWLYCANILANIPAKGF